MWQEDHAIAGKIDAGLTEPGDDADEIASLSSKLAVVYEQMNARLRTMRRVSESSAEDLATARGFAG